MLKNKPVNVALTVLYIIMIIAGIAGAIFIICSPISHLYERIFCLVDFAMLSSAFYYMIGGHRKSVAKYYKAFVILFAVDIFISISAVDASLTSSGFNVMFADFPVRFMISLLPYTPVVIMASATDLGKKKSITCASVTCAIYFITFIISFIFTPGFLRGGSMEYTQLLIKSGDLFLLSSLLLIMTIRKYQDKDERGTI